MTKILSYAILFTALFACSTSNNSNDDEIFNFNTLSEWVDNSQNMNGVINYKLNGDTLEMWTRKGTYDRPKVCLKDRSYGAAEYQFRLFVPEMGIGDQTSVGAFIYHDDHHELDFEIGYGKNEDREKVSAKDDELLCFMTNQDHPFSSTPKPMKYNQWYTCTIKLTVKEDKKYKAEWLVDGELWNTLDLEFGDQYPFKVIVSVENLLFIGDHVSTQRNYGLFDWVKIKEDKN